MWVSVAGAELGGTFLLVVAGAGKVKTVGGSSSSLSSCISSLRMVLMRDRAFQNLHFDIVSRLSRT